MTPKSTWQFKDEWIRDGYRNKVVDPGNLSVAYSGPAALDLFVQKYDPMASVVDHLWLQLAGDSELKRLEVYAHTTPHTTHHTPHTTHPTTTRAFSRHGQGLLGGSSIGFMWGLIKGIESTTTPPRRMNLGAYSRR